MKKAFFAMLSMLFVLASSQPAFAAGKTYTIHNYLKDPITVTLSGSPCSFGGQPTTSSGRVNANSTGTVPSKCGASEINVVTIAKPGTPGAKCWLNVHLLIGLTYNVKPAPQGMNGCTVNSVAP
jgi:hypothetical protein